MNDTINTQETLTPEQVAALMAQVHEETTEGGGEAAQPETTIFITEDTADHAVTVH
jgi:hypothetical protein